MRRFSQRRHLVTLSEINITPLVDLVFVLLIIFVITTPLLEQSINLKLPQGGQPDPRVNPRNVRTIEITPTGAYIFERQPMRLDELQRTLAGQFRQNTNLIVRIRADKDTKYEYVTRVFDTCLRLGITRFSLATEGHSR